MKKTTIYIVIALLCLNFWVRAQDNKAVDVTLKGIQIGQKVPDITITGLHNYKDANGQLATTAKLSDFKGKLLILDFWATWCSPCVAMIPKMDSLQKAFGDKIQFLSVTYQTEKEILPFLEKFEKQQGKHYDLPVVTNSKEMHKLFPHTTLPHYVWIEGSGVVTAITGFQEINEMNVLKAIENRFQMAQKKDMKVNYDSSKPFLVNGNGGDGSNLIYHVAFTGFTEGLSGGGSFRTDSLGNRKISIRNVTIEHLLEVAFSDSGRVFNKNNVMLEVENPGLLNSSKSGEAYRNWMKEGNGFCYELMVPANLANKALLIMREDLRRCFSQYNFKVEQRKLPILSLVRTSEEDKIATKGGDVKVDINGSGIEVRNASIGNLFYRLNFLRRTKNVLVDHTNYKGKVDLLLDANLTDIASLNTELAKYDMKLVENSRDTDVLVVSDKLVKE
ncbi:MAG: redoxin domain-containing protein [Chryseobacterium sp.]|nr:MAG: redoxin domain-containing protein [Chryseobacterium sp.]